MDGGQYRLIRLRYALLLPFLLALGLFLTFHVQFIGYIKHGVESLVSMPNETYLNSTFDGLPLKRANAGYTCNAVRSMSTNGWFVPKADCLSQKKPCSNGACWLVFAIYSFNNIRC